MSPTANVPPPRRVFPVLVFLCFLFAFSSSALAQLAGSVDPGFVATAGGLGSPLVNQIVVLPNGKFYVAGSYQVANGSPRRGLARFNADGTIDPLFVPNLSGVVGNIAVDELGRVVVSGLFPAANGLTQYQITRLNTDGSPDSSFANGAGIPVTGAETIAIDAAGRIVVGGFFNQINGVPRLGIARLNANGSLDTTFNPGLSKLQKVL